MMNYLNYIAGVENENYIYIILVMLFCFFWICSYFVHKFFIKIIFNIKNFLTNFYK